MPSPLARPPRPASPRRAARSAGRSPAPSSAVPRRALAPTSPDPRPTRGDRARRLTGYWGPALAVGVAAAVFAGHRAAEPSLWRDEVSTIIAARRSWDSLADMLSRIDLVHGPYFVIIKLWSMVGGTSPGAVRAVSVLAVALTAVVVARIGTHLFDRWSGFLAGAVIALLPSSTWSAVEARSPALATLLTVCTVWTLLVALRSGRRRAWVAYAVAAAAAVTVFVFTVLPLLATPALVLGRREARLPWAIATGSAALAVAPYGWAVVSQRSMVGWVQPWDPARWPLVASDVLTPTIPVPAIWIGLLVSLVVGAVVILAGRAAGTAVRRSERVVLLVGWAVLPATVVIALSVISPPGFYVPRYLLPCVPAFALLAAAALGAIRPRVVGSAVVVALLVVTVPVWHAQRLADYKGPFRQIAERVAAERRPGDAALFGTISDTAGSSRAMAYGYPAAFAGVEDLTLERPFTDNAGLGLWETSGPLAAHRDRLDRAGRVWVILPPEVPTADLTVLRDTGFSSGPVTRYPGGYTVQVWDRGPTAPPRTR